MITPRSSIKATLVAELRAHVDAVMEAHGCALSGVAARVGICQRLVRNMIGGGGFTIDLYERLRRRLSILQELPRGDRNSTRAEVLRLDEGESSPPEEGALPQ